MKTYAAKPADISRQWWVIDARDVVLGRMASHVAKILRGKHKAIYSTHLDCGDHVVIINADKVKITGNKLTDKTYYRHTGFPGGIKETTPQKIFAGKHPHRVVEKAIERMMPRNPMGRAQLKKLKVLCRGVASASGATAYCAGFWYIEPKKTNAKLFTLRSRITWNWQPFKPTQPPKRIW
jgi:large subunit ribosomal protein L13